MMASLHRVGGEGHGHHDGVEPVPAAPEELAERVGEEVEGELEGKDGGEEGVGVVERRACLRVVDELDLGHVGGEVGEDEEGEEVLERRRGVDDCRPVAHLLQPGLGLLDAPRFLGLLRQHRHDLVVVVFGIGLDVVFSA